MRKKESKMKKLLGKYFKRGISILIPFVGVTWVLNLIYGTFSNIVIMLLPTTMEYEWYYVIVFIVGLFIIIELIGFVFSTFKLVKWFKKKFDKLVKKVPLVGKLYNFGLEIVDSFVSDVKEDGDLQVIEIAFGEFKLLGVLTDPVNDLGFLISAPSPLTGVVIKLPRYKKLDMTFMQAVQINTSLGKIGGSLWK